MRAPRVFSALTTAFVRSNNRSSIAFWRFASLMLALALLAPMAAQAQTNYVYVSNQSASGNTISGFSVDHAGLLTSLGTPVGTGGTGATVLCSGVDRMVVNGTTNLLFVANSGNQTISVLRVAPATGALTAVAGSPFASGLTLDSCAGISLASTPNGKFLMAAANGQINTFSVAAATGALSLVSTVAGLPTPSVSLNISGNGQFLAASNQSSVSVFTINLDGSLTAVAGSPFAKQSTGLLSGLEFNCSGTQLYGSEGGTGTASAIADAWSVAPTGALTPLLASPFTGAGSDSNVVYLTPDNTVLFQSNQGSNNLNSFIVNADGSLTSIGGFSGTSVAPAGLASDNSGLFLYAADDAFGLAVFNIFPNAIPTLVAQTQPLFPLTPAGQIQGIAAYPPKSCAQADFSITQTASPNPVTAGSQVTYTITITNHGPSTASVAINDLLPRLDMTFGGCIAGPGGVCDKGAGLNRTITFASLGSGQSGTVTLLGATLSTLLNNDTMSNTALVSNASTVDPNPVDNSSTTSVTVSAPPSASKFTVANATGNYFGTTNLSATLARVFNGAAVAGRTVTFSLNGATMGTATTNASGVATLSNVSLAGINAGPYPTGVGVSFAGDDQFAASTGTAILTVNKLPLTVTTQNAAKFFGDANPAFTYVITGFVNNETAAVVSGAASCSTPAGSNTPPGPFTISCSVGTLSAANYAFVFVPATLTINPAPLVLAANNASRLYGDPNPALTGTVVGLKAGNQATATFSTTAVATSSVGSYPITGSVVPGPGFVATNYSISSTGTLAVTPAPLTGTANNATRLYGDPNPTFTGTVTGARNGDQITATFASTADPTSPIGTYPITATLTGPIATNYTVTNNAGILTITQAPLSVSAANTSRLYGDPNPAFTGTITGIKNADPITATYASAATAASAVGTAAIIPTLVDPAGKLGNYTVTSNNGVLTINPAPLVVAAANASRLYGDPNPVFTGTITGIKNGDGITATFSSATDPTSPVGTFAIVPALADPNGKLPNYTVTSANGTLTINPAPLTVAAANASRLYGDPNPAFTGTITGIKNADNITATFSSTATAASSVGPYPITATLVDPTNKLGNYAVTSTPGTLTVGPATLTVASSNASRLYGDPNPAFTGAITGLKNNDNITATFASAATAASAVGAYPITATLADPGLKLGNYTVVSNNGSLTVNPAALTVTATDATRAYGDPNPAFTGTITGLKNSDNITAIFASTAIAGSPVGAYPISPTLVDPTGQLANYTVNSVNGTLTVTAAALTVTAGNATRAYGDPNPAFTGTITGLRNGDNITATFATTATLVSGVGSYPITPNLVDAAGKLGNYTVNSVNGTLSVTQAALTVTAANANRFYGDANSVFTGTIVGLKNGDNITATFSSAATPASSVGTFAIVPTLSDLTAKLSNYSPTLVNGVLTVNPAPLTVSAASLSRVYGDPNPTFSGTVTGLKNGDVITASFSTTATVLSAVGAYPITSILSDPGLRLANYSVVSNDGTLTITAAALSVSAANATRVYGDANPAFTGTITGLKNSDNITATFSSADATNPVGAYPIVPALVDPDGKLGNYTVTSTNGTLTVTAAALSVSAANASRAYGDPNPVFTGTILGLKNGDNITATFSGADATSPVGAYAIVPALVDPTGKLGNYTVTLTNGTLTVTQAALTVTAANASRIYGDANPVFTGTIAGLRNGDIVTATFTSAATSASTVGTYAIVSTLADPAAKLSNYTVISNNGALTITQAPLVVTAANASRVFGKPDPVFTGTITGIKNADNITARFTTAATATSPAGTYPIIPALADPASKLPNYAVTLNNGILTVIGLPTALSVSPSAGSATNVVLSAVYSDDSGGAAITDGYLLVNDVVVWACGVRYHPATNQLFLINEAGTTFQPGITLGSTATLQNSKCILDAATSSASVSGNNLIVNFSIRFQPTFVGKKNIYMEAIDSKNNLNSGWTQLGTWTPPAPTPAPVSVTPGAGTGTSAIFSAVYSDAAGADKITDGYLLVNNVLVWACGVRYHPATNQLFLINEAGTTFQPGVTLGSTATLQNSKCILDAATSSASVSGNNLIVNFSIRFQPTFVGKKNIYMEAIDSKNNLNSGWTQLGTWTPPAPTPAPVSVTPNAGTGTSAIFSAVYSDAAGADKITDGYLLVNNVLVWACGVRYHPATNQLFLINEAGTTFQPGVTLGSTAVLQNSKCILDAATSSASVSGNNLIVNFSIRFQPTFVGNKNIYMEAIDSKDNLNSGWTQLGTWNLP